MTVIVVWRVILDVVDSYQVRNVIIDGACLVFSVIMEIRFYLGLFKFHEICPLKAVLIRYGSSAIPAFE
jgi:hypothetical protein